MAKRIKRRLVKKSDRCWTKKWVLIISAMLSILVASIIFICVYAFNSLGLKGVSFSEKSGFYDDAIEVELFADGILVAGPIDIKYNLNGDDLASTSELYSGKIKLEVPENGYKMYTITAQVCKKDGECLSPQVATYVLGKKINEDITIDIININSTKKNLYDYDYGIMVGGRTYDLNEATGNSAYIAGNYNNRGKKWVRDAHFTMFDVNKNLVRDQKAYIEISGGTSSAYDTKSFKVTLPVVDDENENSDNRSETFRLRSGSQDQFTGNIRSSVASRLVEESGFNGGTSTRRVVVFLNGEYYGIFDKQENFSEQNLAEKFGLNKKHIEKSKGSESVAFAGLEIDKNIWKNLDNEEKREQLEKIVDMDNYLQYYAIQILLNNTDWPMNNYGVWRYDGKKQTNNQYEDGRIRFLMYDMDLIYYTREGIQWFEGATGDIFEFLMEGEYNGAGATFPEVMKSEYYRTRFIEILEDLLNGPFATKNVLKITDEEKSKIEHQVKLFSSNEEYEKWAEEIELMKKAIKMREQQIKDNVWDYFEIEI